MSNNNTNNSAEDESLEFTRDTFKSLDPEAQQSFRSETKSRHWNLCQVMDHQEAVLKNLQDKVISEGRDLENRYRSLLVPGENTPTQILEWGIRDIKAQTQGGVTLWQTFMNLFKDEDTLMRQQMLILNDRHLSHVKISNLLHIFSKQYKAYNANLESEIMQMRVNFRPVQEELIYVDKSVQIQFPMKPSIVDDFADVSTEPMDHTGGDD